MSAGPLRLRLPATSANLGPGFDAAGLAMDMWLEIEAEAAETDAIGASGRNSDVVGCVSGNLILETYRDLLPTGSPLRLRIQNDIPLGMGCGSSAAALLAGVALANHFGRLGWTPEQVRDEACRREGHPDNVAACFHGGFTVSSMDDTGHVTAASFAHDLQWPLLLAIPRQGLRTSVARALLPERYIRADAIVNVQATAMLVAAFSLDRPELLLAGTKDRLHQPFRNEVCPLLPKLLPLAGQGGVRSVTLSGAGPSVLMVMDEVSDRQEVLRQVAAAAGEPRPELVLTRIGRGMRW